MKPSAEVFPSP